MPANIRTALLSVSDKTGIVEFAQFLASQNIALLSTGGTAKALKDAGLNVTDVSDITGFPEIMDGRVKTLHPKVHGGLLGRRDVPSHQQAMEEHDIAPIDMIVVNLYPFEATVEKGANFETCIENIDIGGPSMIRSAAKNHHDVVVITDHSHYAIAQSEIANTGNVSAETRKRFAFEAFSRTAAYDAAISRWFSEHVDSPLSQSLRYGENPHQSARLVRTNFSIPGVASAKQLQGKELSYNNLSDTDAAFDLVSEFTEPACAIIKHANPCGIATGHDITDAYKRALACDPVSAYGGILAFNQAFNGEMAQELGKLFAEVIIAPEFTAEAKDILSAKKNLRLLETGTMPDATRNDVMIKSIAGGFLEQSRDNTTFDESQLKIVTDRQPSEQEMQDLRFAFTVCKHVKSNAIVFAKDNATVGIGAGQMSRVDSSRIGAWKAKETATSVEDASGSVFASDAFLPFADGLISAAEHGITAVIQPGGSIRDQEVIDAANERNIAMVFTGTRHFRH